MLYVGVDYHGQKEQHEPLVSWIRVAHPAFLHFSHPELPDFLQRLFGPASDVTVVCGVQYFFEAFFHFARMLSDDLFADRDRREACFELGGRVVQVGHRHRKRLGRWHGTQHAEE